MQSQVHNDHFVSVNHAVVSVGQSATCSPMCTRDIMSPELCFEPVTIFIFFSIVSKWTGGWQAPLNCGQDCDGVLIVCFFPSVVFFICKKQKRD